MNKVVIGLSCLKMNIFSLLGTKMTLRPRGLLNAKKLTGSQVTEPTCNKETVGNRRLQKWSRGAFAIVNSGGHIRYVKV